MEICVQLIVSFILDVSSTKCIDTVFRYSQSLTSFQQYLLQQMHNLIFIYDELGLHPLCMAIYTKCYENTIFLKRESKRSTRSNTVEMLGDAISQSANFFSFYDAVSSSALLAYHLVTKTLHKVIQFMTRSCTVTLSICIRFAITD